MKRKVRVYKKQCMDCGGPVMQNGGVPNPEEFNQFKKKHIQGVQRDTKRNFKKSTAPQNSNMQEMVDFNKKRFVDYLSQNTAINLQQQAMDELPPEMYMYGGPLPEYNIGGEGNMYGYNPNAAQIGMYAKANAKKQKNFNEAFTNFGDVASNLTYDTGQKMKTKYDKEVQMSDGSVANARKAYKNYNKQYRKADKSQAFTAMKAADPNFTPFDNTYLFDFEDKNYNVVDQVENQAAQYAKYGGDNLPKAKYGLPEKEMYWDPIQAAFVYGVRPENQNTINKEYVDDFNNKAANNKFATTDDPWTGKTFYYGSNDYIESKTGKPVYNNETANHYNNKNINPAFNYTPSPKELEEMRLRDPAQYELYKESENNRIAKLNQHVASYSDRQDAVDNNINQGYVSGLSGAPQNISREEEVNEEEEVKIEKVIEDAKADATGKSAGKKTNTTTKPSVGKAGDKEDAYVETEAGLITDDDEKGTGTGQGSNQPLGVIYGNNRRQVAPVYYNPNDTHLSKVNFRKGFLGMGKNRVKSMEFDHYGSGRPGQPNSEQGLSSVDMANHLPPRGERMKLKTPRTSLDKIPDNQINLSDKEKAYYQDYNIDELRQAERNQEVGQGNYTARSKTQPAEGQPMGNSTNSYGSGMHQGFGNPNVNMDALNAQTQAASESGMSDAETLKNYKNANPGVGVRGVNANGEIISTNPEGFRHGGPYYMVGGDIPMYQDGSEFMGAVTPEEQAMMDQQRLQMAQTETNNFNQQEGIAVNSPYATSKFATTTSKDKGFDFLKRGPQMGAVLGAGMGLASAAGRFFTEPVNNMYDKTSGDQVFDVGVSDKGKNTVNPLGLGASFDPSGVLEATQFTGVARYGGDQGDYDMGGEYELTDEEIEYILANGGEIEFLD